jgi:hypothetical protein
MLIPVHTESPGGFEELFSNVEMATDGVPFSI